MEESGPSLYGPGFTDIEETVSRDVSHMIWLMNITRATLLEHCSGTEH